MPSPADALREKFSTVVETPAIGAAGVLNELSALAGKCVGIFDRSRTAVAFALEVLFALHAEDRTDRIVTGNDNYVLVANGLETIQAAIDFVHKGGSDNEAISLVAALAGLTPRRISGRK
jgi:hypothetical protein